MKEIWKDIHGYEGVYMISNIGRVKSLERNVKFGNQIRTIKENIRKNKKKSNGYLFIQLFTNHKDRCCYIHRLVAMSFCDGYFKKADVNHKDGNKSNNVYTNLEWCTRSENIIHSVKVLGNKLGPRKGGIHYNSIPIIQFDKDGKFIKYWNSASDASIIGINESNIRACLYGTCKHGKRITAGGFKWKYAKEK